MNIQSQRLTLTELTLADAPMVLALLNQPDFIRNIADRQVRTVEQAEQYLLQGPLASYRQHGFGMWLVRRNEDKQAIGLCGLLQRDFLPVPDLGYAVFQAFSGQGYTSEAAAAVLGYAREQLGLTQLCAIVAPANQASIRVLHKCGFQSQPSAALLSLPDSGKQVLYLTLALSVEPSAVALSASSKA